MYEMMGMILFDRSLLKLVLGSKKRERKADACLYTAYAFVLTKVVIIDERLSVLA